MNNIEFINWIRLIRSENIGPMTFHNLIKLYSTATNAIEKIPELARNGGLKRNIKIAQISDILKEIEKVEQYGGEILLSKDNDYPYYLKNIEDHPPILTIFGNKELFKRKSIAIVGSRNSSINGCNFAQKIAYELGSANYIITSGLARGIDSAAHKASINSGTIAVIASGINIIYPPENKLLAEEIAKNGVIVTELPFNSTPKAQNFPQRNRIISGLSVAVIIIEATLNSGSLITARNALEQNKDVFAVPGFPTDPRHAGTNYLIKQGAYPLTSSNDIIEMYNDKNFMFQEEMDNQYIHKENKFSSEELKEARKKILNLLSCASITIDQIISHLEMPLPLVMIVIIELELAGKISREYGNKITLIYNLDEICV